MLSRFPVDLSTECEKHPNVVQITVIHLRIGLDPAERIKKPDSIARVVLVIGLQGVQAFEAALIVLVHYPDDLR